MAGAALPTLGRHASQSGRAAVCMGMHGMRAACTRMPGARPPASCWPGRCWEGQRPALAARQPAPTACLEPAQQAPLAPARWPKHDPGKTQRVGTCPRPAAAANTCHTPRRFCSWAWAACRPVLASRPPEGSTPMQQGSRPARQRAGCPIAGAQARQPLAARALLFPSRHTQSPASRP